MMDFVVVFVVICIFGISIPAKERTLIYWWTLGVFLQHIRIIFDNPFKSDVGMKRATETMVLVPTVLTSRSRLIFDSMNVEDRV